MKRPHLRIGVVLVIRRDDGCVLAFERADVRGAWQLPQGGIDAGESVEQAAWRELGEETGLGADDVRLTGVHDDWTVYTWPAEVRGTSSRWGQAHRWVFFEPLGEIQPVPDGHEFVDWTWMDVDELVDGVVGFRRRPYEQVLRG